MNSTLTDINSKLTIISDQQGTILERLRKFNKYDIKFDIYFEDIRVLNDLEINVSREKALSYNKYIINGLKNHSDYFLTDKETKEIKELLNFQKIKDYLVKYLFTDAEEEAGKLYDIVKSINEKYLGESLGNRVINFYNNITFIHQIINNYYKDISEAYKKFNTTFVDEYYHKHKDQYVTKPKEIINKILGVSYALNPEKVTLHKEIQELIVNKIRLGITTTSYEVYSIILKEYNDLIQSFSNNKCCINGYNFANLEKVKRKLNEFQSIYIKNDKFIVPYNYTVKYEEDEFDIKDFIVSKENEIRINLRRIADLINTDFIKTFCYGNELVCAYPDIVSGIDHYYYQASKLRVSLQFLQSLVTIAQSMIGDDIFSDFDSNTYTQLFNLELNYRGNEIITDITNFLSELNNETIHYINGSLDKLKIDIESYFKSGVNLLGMKENIETIGREIFFDPSHLKKQIFDYIYYPCGPISKLEVAFNEEIDFHDIIS